MTTDGVFSGDPIEWFRHELARATSLEAFDATRAALATVDASGQPSVRYVLVKHVDDRGFAFFTNLGSAKAHALATSPRAALAFHWASTDTQVRVEGPVERVSDAEADAYFASRPRGSQLAAWASQQSSPIESRSALEAQLREVESRFPGDTPVTRPSFWGGFRIQPTRIEVWKNRDFRLHDRWSFTRERGEWSCIRLQP